MPTGCAWARVASIPRSLSLARFPFLRRRKRQRKGPSAHRRAATHTSHCATASPGRRPTVAPHRRPRRRAEQRSSGGCAPPPTPPGGAAVQRGLRTAANAAGRSSGPAGVARRRPTVRRWPLPLALPATEEGETRESASGGWRPRRRMLPPHHAPPRHASRVGLRPATSPSLPHHVWVCHPPRLGRPPTRAASLTRAVSPSDPPRLGPPPTPRASSPTRRVHASHTVSDRRTLARFGGASFPALPRAANASPVNRFAVAIRDLFRRARRA